MKKVLISLIIVLCVIGCKNKEISSNQSFSSDKIINKDFSDVEVTDSVKGEESPSTNKPKQVNAQEIQRQLVKTGTINYNVDEIKTIEKSVEIKVKEFGGYVSSSNFTLNSGVITLKIPFNKFDEFLSISGSFGKITSKTINVDDVTMQYYDLENQIKNRKILQERFQNHLSKAIKIEDMIKIETELNRVTEEIEGLEGQFKNLSHLISFSTLTLNFYQPGNNVVVKSFPSIKKGFGDFGFAFVNFLYVLFFIILYFVIFGIPIVLILGLLYFITFGKIGLIKKLFKKLSGK